MPIKPAVVCSASVLLLLLFASQAPARCQGAPDGAPALLIVSQQPVNATKDEPYVDLAPHIERQLNETGKYKPIVFKPSLAALHTSDADKFLSPMDLVVPTSRDSVRKIARFLRANFILYVNARLTKSGVAGLAEMEKLVGQQSWGGVFSEKLDAYRGTRKQPSSLEGILVHVATIMQKLTNAPSTVPVGEAVTVTIPTNKPKDKRGAAKSEQSRAAAKIEQAKTASQKNEKPPELAKVPDKPEPKDPFQPAQPQVIEPKPAPRSTSPAVTVSATELLADRFRRQGDLANLIIALRKGVNERPKDVRLRQDLVRAYLERGWQSSAKDEALRAISLAPNEPVLHRLVGDCCQAAGDGEGAVSAYREAVRLDPKDGGNYVALGDALLGITRSDEAQLAFSNAVAADQKNPTPHRRLARVFAQNAKYADCVREMGLAKDLAASEDAGLQVIDYSEILGIAETNLRVSLARLYDIRKSLVSGARTREQSHGDCMAQKKKAEEMATFLESLQAPPQLARITALYAQAASLAVQLSEASLQWIETQESKSDDEASLLRIETGKQLDDASKKLKALSAAKL